VAYVENGGAAAEAGLPRGVVITALDSTPVATPEDVRAYVTNAEGPVLVTVRRPDGTQAFYEVD